jgi:hypothetical protein
MSHLRYVPKTLSDLPTTAFDSSEEAWFWFIRCQQVRREGAQLSTGCGGFSRPCDPDDVYRAVMSLTRQGLLARAHLAVLGTFGISGRPPDARRADEGQAARLWEEALDRLSTILKAKGIVV